MLRKSLTMLALAALAFPTHVVAEHCTGPNLDRHSEELRINDPETGATIYYIDVDTECAPDCATTMFWMYEETNGFPNLQRQDATGANVTPYTQDDTCHRTILPDAIVLHIPQP